MNKLKLTYVLFLAGMLFSEPAAGQQEIIVDVSPTISRAIEGNLSLNRSKYINLAESGTSIEHKIGNSSKVDYYFRDLDMTLGRALGMVYTESRWGNSIFEDPARAGYADISRMIENLDPSNGSTSPEFMELIGENQNVAFHDRHDSYPDFMEKYTYEGANDHFPVNNDAASELAAELLEHKYTNWTRPAYYEPVNEPHWKFWSDDRFIEFHTSIHEKVRAKGLKTEVGGPCLSVAYFYKDKFSATKQITNFIDNTNFGLDFYSFHVYDYMSWSEADLDITGSITSGLPIEGVLDAVANYTYNKYGEALTYVASEHGAYITDGDARKQMEATLSDLYFPGSDFANTMERRSISDHISASAALANTLAYMYNPHIVKKSVPFILLETTGWDPTYYASLLVADNFTDKNNWQESDLLHFYQFFDDVDGRRILSHCNDNDIQHHAFVNGSTLILIFNNVSNVGGSISLNIDETEASIKDMNLRRYGRNMDFRPYLSEERIFDTDEISIAGREALALFIEYDEEIAEDEILNEEVHYGNQTSVTVNGPTDFEVATPDFSNAEYAVLRIGIGLPKSTPKEMNVSINGTALTIPVEDAMERYNDGSEYGSSRSVKFDPALLQAVNTVTIEFPGQSGGVGAVIIRAGYPSADTLVSFEISPENLHLYEYEEQALRVSYFPETTNERDLNWSSMDDQVATVSDEGLVTGVAEGTTKIIASNPDDMKADTIMVSVSKQDLSSNADKSGWTVAWVDNEATVKPMPAENAIDDDLNTYWHTEWQVEPKPGLPHEIWIDMGKVHTFNKFIYTPRQDPWGPNGTIGEFELYFSDDTAAWGEPVVTGSFDWGVREGQYYKKIQEVELPTEVSARYFRLVALTEHQDDPEVPTTCVAEMDVSVPITGIALEEDTVYISMYEELSLEVNSLPGMSTIAGNQFAWSSSDISVAQVEQGNITGAGEGLAKIYVSTFDGLHKDSMAVEVSIVSLEGINISEEAITIEIGETHVLTASVEPANAYYNSWTWSSEDESIATVEMGYVTGVKPGSTDIKVLSNDGSTYDICTVTVEEEVSNAITNHNSTEMAIYPNPAYDYLNIDLPLEGTVQIINSKGQVIGSSQHEKGIHALDIAVNMAGLHFIRYISDQFVDVKRVLIMD